MSYQNFGLGVTGKNRVELEAFWMPFTANRQFKNEPRLLASAEGMYYTTVQGQRVLDGTAGLWCVNLGHGRQHITDAVGAQLSRMDYAPIFQMGHPAAFELANRLVKHSPESLNHVFFTNSGSEAVDTALKIALAYHHIRGEAGRTRLIGREKGYHGVGFGGISVGGLGNNRKAFANLLPSVDHLPHTLDLNNNAFTRGLPAQNHALADELHNIVDLHGVTSIAAVIVEPIAGSAGVILPPKGYLQRLREICDQYGILLIFDEVITGFGRTGSSFAATEFGVTPDLITCAKGLTNGSVPMGAVFVRDDIHDAFMHGPENAVELFHGYTYSAHPVACAAALAALDIYEQENLLPRAKKLASYWEDSVHKLADCPHVKDIRNYGLIAGIEFNSIAGKPGTRAYEIYKRCYQKGLLTRQTGDILALSPPLVIEKEQIDQLFEILDQVIKECA